MKKKHWSLLLRILLAAAGLAYIVYIIDWIDHVNVEPGAYTLAPGQTYTTATKKVFRVTSGDFDPKYVSRPITIAIEDPGQPAQTWTILPAELKDPKSGLTIRPGIITTLRHADLSMLGWGLIIIFPIYPITAFRWWMLLRARGLVVHPWQAFRLCMVGCFFNYCMPGSTGGDVVKAYYAAKNSDRRADAVMTVIIDRIVGLLGLIILGGIAGLFIKHDPAVRKVTVYIWIVAAMVIVVSALYFSRHLRKTLGIDWLLAKLLPKDSLPAKIDQAAVAYSYHKPTVTTSILLSLPVHFLLAISTSLAGWALGMNTPLTTMLAAVPMVFLVMAIPISPQGVGTGEFVAVKLLAGAGLATANQVVVMLMVARLYQLIYSLSGAVFLLKGDIHLHPEGEKGDAETKPVETTGTVA